MKIRTRGQINRQQESKFHDILQKLKNHDLIDPFLTPVNEKEDHAPNYYKIIQNPIDVQTIEKKLKKGNYEDFESFDKDIELIWSNSFLYNKKSSVIGKVTKQLQQFYHKLTLTNGLRTDKSNIKRK